MPKKKITYVIYSAVIIISIIAMLSGIRFFLMEGHKEIGKYVVTNIGDIESSFTKDTEIVLKGLGEEIIRLRAEKVAKDIENYIIRHPRSTIKDLQNDPQFKPVAIQLVGKTGYTAVHESKTSINRFHNNPKIINTNLGALAVVLPDFWKIIIESREHREPGGYYRWREADGRVREKYMWVATASLPTADGILLDVAATTYIDEFIEPLMRLSEKLQGESAVTSARVISMSKGAQNRTLIAILIIILIFCGMSGYMAVRLVQGYRRIEREVEVRKKIESELLKLAAVVEHSSELVNLADLDGKMIFLNEAGGIMLGIPPGDVAKHSIVEIIPDELKSKIENEVLPAIFKQGRWEGDLQYCNLVTGALIDVHAMTFAIRNSDGDPLYLANVSLDITEHKRAEEAIRQSEELHKALTEKSIAGVYVVQDGKFRFINSNAASYAGYTREELLGQDASIVISPEDGEQVRQNARAMLIGEISSPYEFRIITKQGEARWIMETVTSIVHEGRPAILGNSMDITNRKRVEEALQENRSRLADIITFLPDATLAVDKEKRIIIWNKAIEEMTGVPAAEMIGEGDYVYTIPFYGEARPQLMDLVFLDNKEITARYPNITREGDSLTAEAFCNALYNNKGAWVFVKASPLHDQYGNITGAIEIVRDITEHKRIEAEILALSIADQLTGLHNRRGFLSLARQQFKIAERNKSGMLLFFADLDGLKWINDTLGHEEGDKALIEAATVFKETFRTSDIIARLGGDEYAALAIGITEANSGIITARLRDLIDMQNTQESRRYRLSISVGCSYYDPENPCSIDELMASADKLMYAQKQSKKDLLLQGASLSSSNPYPSMHDEGKDK